MTLNDKYINDKLNYILLITKGKDYKLNRKEKLELNRLKSKGYNIGEGHINEYAKILQQKSYVKFKKLGKENEIELSITETGLKALKYNHLPSNSKNERKKRIFTRIQNTGIIISILASIVAMILGIKSCNNKSEIHNINQRIDKIELKINGAQQHLYVMPQYVGNKIIKH